MKYRNRLLSLAMAAALALGLSLPVRAADPLADSFSHFLIDAKDVSAPEQTLRVALYRRDENGNFQKDVTVRYNCNVNLAAGESAFYIQPQTSQVWVEVDYLTDLDGDGVYEMLDGEGDSVSDLMTNRGKLVARSSVESPWSNSTYKLTKGKTYTLSPDALKKGAKAAIEARSSSGEQALNITPTDTETVLYYITVHYLSNEDQLEYTLGYYISLLDSLVIMPGDVSESDWFYSAVEYALDKGFITGTGENTFSPYGAVTRGQLAQILWRLGGSAAAEDAGFADVSANDWYYKAVSWCKQEGLMDGTDRGFEPNNTLTREQLALVLRNFAQRAGADVSGGKSLDSFKDGASASAWAMEGLEWAVDRGLFSGNADGTLHPGKGIIRAELAAVLRTFCQTYPKAVTFS